jgi:hypothetical protein
MLKPVILTELEFNKLIRYTEAVAAIEFQADLELLRLKNKVAGVRQVKQAYFDSLVEKYPDLNADTSYTPVESDFTLYPNVKDEECPTLLTKLSDEKAGTRRRTTRQTAAAGPSSG